MRFGLILLVLLFAGAGALFGSLNSQSIDLDFYFGSFALGKGAALLLALLAGWLLGGLLVWAGMVLTQRSCRQRRTFTNDAGVPHPHRRAGDVAADCRAVGLDPRAPRQ